MTFLAHSAAELTLGLPLSHFLFHSSLPREFTHQPLDVVYVLVPLVVAGVVVPLVVIDGSSSVY